MRCRQGRWFAGRTGTLQFYSECTPWHSRAHELETHALALAKDSAKSAKVQSAELLKPQARPVNAHSVEAPMKGSRKYTRSLSCGNSEVQGAMLNNKTHSLARKDPPHEGYPTPVWDGVHTPRGLDESLLGCVECHPEGAVSLTR